jgi:hypothetical protein
MRKILQEGIKSIKIFGVALFFFVANLSAQITIQWGLT